MPNAILLKILLGQVRHLLTVVGGMLVTNGYASTSDVEILTGAATIVVGMVWSAITKEKRQ